MSKGHQSNMQKGQSRHMNQTERNRYFSTSSSGGYQSDTYARQVNMSNETALRNLNVRKALLKAVLAFGFNKCSVTLECSLGAFFKAKRKNRFFHNCS